jgi:uncharacterized coiled-coil DUF342 family protein
MSEEPENLVLQLLRGIRAEVAGVRAEVAEVNAKVDRRIDELRDELTGQLTSEIHSLRADLASDIATMQKETREQITGLRRAVIEYHSSVVGHGLLISEHEERIRRIEQTLNLPPLRAS